MPTCPNGHQSAADDWCGVCGHRMFSAPGAPTGAVPPPPPSPPPSPPPIPGQGGGYGYPGPGGGATMQAEPCPQCRTPRESQAAFCGKCGYNFTGLSPASYASPPPPGGTGMPLPPGFRAQDPPGPPQHGQQPPVPPQHGQPQPPYGQPPYGQPQHGQPPYGQPPYGQPQHEQPQHGQSDYGRPGYGQPPGPQTGGDDDWTLPPPGAPAPDRHDQHPHGRPDYGQPPHGQPDYGQPPHGQSDYGQHPQGPPPPQQPSTWLVTIGPDREYFTAMMQRSGPEAAGLSLPAYSSEQQVQLSGPQVTIGRRRHSTGESPDIDLARPPEDPGVSHQHAVLVQQPDGSWSVMDQDSTNGTTINGAEDPIQPFVPVPLQEGDRVHIGAWTTITLYRG